VTPRAGTWYPLQDSNSQPPDPKFVSLTNRSLSYLGVAHNPLVLAISSGYQVTQMTLEPSTIWKGGAAGFFDEIDNASPFPRFDLDSLYADSDVSRPALFGYHPHVANWP
jgi:hypothetical protein